MSISGVEDSAGMDAWNFEDWGIQAPKRSPFVSILSQKSDIAFIACQAAGANASIMSRPFRTT